MGRKVVWMTVVTFLVVGCKGSEPAADTGSTIATDMSVEDMAVSPDEGVDAASMPDMVQDLGEADADVTSPTFDRAVFRATHNSYSGNARGTIVGQLDGGVRFIEFDIHADAFATNGWEVGHDYPDHEVDHTAPNPATTNLEDWLDAIDEWRDQNRSHLPITIGLDLKSPLSSIATPAEGNLAALNQMLKRRYGPRLVSEAEVANGWPVVDDVRDQMIVVLSGDTTSRLDYRRTVGANPAVAVDESGRTVVAHESGADVRVWSGDGTRFDWFEIIPGASDPAIARNGQGVALVYLVGDTLWVQTGRVDLNGFEWSTAVPFVDADPARAPSIRFVAGELIEIHETLTGEVRHWTGSWNGFSNSVDAWTSSADTTPRFDETADGTFSVSAMPAGPYTDDVVHIDDGTGPVRVRLNQLMFSEGQLSGPAEFEDDGVLVFAADQFSNQGVAWATEKRQAGAIVRLWKFDLPNILPDPPVTFPATDLPDSEFYVEYCANVGCLTDN